MPNAHIFVLSQVHRQRYGAAFIFALSQHYSQKYTAQLTSPLPPNSSTTDLKRNRATSEQNCIPISISPTTSQPAVIAISPSFPLPSLCCLVSYDHQSKIQKIQVNARTHRKETSVHRVLTGKHQPHISLNCPTVPSRTKVRVYRRPRHTDVGGGGDGDGVPVSIRPGGKGRKGGIRTV
jgi:hypothetical protein